MQAWGIAPGIRLPRQATPKAFGESVQQVVSQSRTEVNRAFSADVVLGFHESWGAAPGWR